MGGKDDAGQKGVKATRNGRPGALEIKRKFGSW